MGKDERGQDTKTKDYENLVEHLTLYDSLISMLCEPPGPFSVLCFHTPWFLIAQEKHPRHTDTQLSTQDAIQDTRIFMICFKATDIMATFPSSLLVPQPQ